MLRTSVMNLARGISFFLCLCGIAAVTFGRARGRIVCVT
jgi:hypothetical protein